LRLLTPCQLAAAVTTRCFAGTTMMNWPPMPLAKMGRRCRYGAVSRSIYQS
jgi:hypothetical protein